MGSNYVTIQVSSLPSLAHLILDRGLGLAASGRQTQTPVHKAAAVPQGEEDV